MSRGQDNAELLALQVADPRMLAIPLVAGSLWLRMVEAMRRMGATTLRFGGYVPDEGEMARSLSVSVEELRTGLEPLVQVGLLVQEPDGALSSPLLVAQAERRRLAAERRATLQHAVDEEPQPTNVVQLFPGRTGGAG